MAGKKKMKKVGLSRFARTERTSEPKAEDVEAAKNSGEMICPCGEENVDYRCAKCGATKHVNPVSGNVSWMKNGRLVRAFKDEKDAYIQMANDHGIPKERWPSQFR